jgi:predicted dehydrogenase/threonine dehydrogenase-like Zn-dependent dehydrogenase
LRQVARRLRDGRLELVEVPDPALAPGHVAVRVEASLVSAGTERATLDVARKGLIAKARARPDQARQVIERARREGVRSTVDLVRQRLDELGPLGYSAAGVAVEVGEGVRGISPGDRLAIAGGGAANHAEIDVVPALLCAPIPDGVGFEDASFATLGAIAMHGFRRADVQVGSRVAVVGLGLVGQLAVRIALAAGCRVLGVDLSERFCALAAEAGAETALRGELDDASAWAAHADAVLVCASAPGSDDPVRLAAMLARDRAPVVIVGDVKLDLPRGPYYDRELDLRLSRSYGPGRYDPAYELHGHDYPIGYVRWTEGRNIESFLDLVASGRIDPGPLVTHRYPFERAEEAFELLTADDPEGGRPIGIVLQYESAARPARPAPAPARPRRPAGAKPRFGLIGAGRFASATIVPGLIAAGLEPGAVASAGGLSAEDLRRRFEFGSAHSDPGELIDSGGLDLIAIATRHDTHAELAARALRAGIAVYVEKPLALDAEGLTAVRDAQAATGAPLVVGFNRRHAPIAARLRELPGPRLMAYRVNAGRLPLEHWTNDPEVGGGRLLGEGCHFVDFLCDQAPGDPLRVSARGFRSDPSLPLLATDNFTLQIDFSDGSAGTVNYAADAPTGPGKERFETSSPGVYAALDDFRSGELWRGSQRTRLGGRAADKGWSGQYEMLAAVLSGRSEAPPVEGYLLSTLATLAAARSLSTGAAEAVTEPAGERDAEAVTR